MSNANEPIYPTIQTDPRWNCSGETPQLYAETYSNGGLTKREHAAILLRVPKSGDDEIDALIREANRRDAAAMAMYGYIAQRLRNYSDIANESIDTADSLIAELERTA